MATRSDFTYAIPAGAGDVLDLGVEARAFELRTDSSAGTADVWVCPVYDVSSAPDAPSGTPAPSAGDQSAAGWQHLKGAGDPYIPPKSEWSYCRYIKVWGIAVGGLSVSGIK